MSAAVYTHTFPLSFQNSQRNPMATPTWPSALTYPHTNLTYASILSIVANHICNHLNPVIP